MNHGLLSMNDFVVHVLCIFVSEIGLLAQPTTLLIPRDDDPGVRDAPIRRSCCFDTEMGVLGKNILFSYNLYFSGSHPSSELHALRG